MTDFEKIKEICKIDNLTLNALSKHLGLKTPQIFYDIKSGKHGISKALADKIKEKYLNINLSWLLADEKKMFRNEEDEVVQEEIKDANSYTVKELIAAIKRRDEHVEALIRVNEKYADSFTELLKQLKKKDAPKDGGAMNADAEGFSGK